MSFANELQSHLDRLSAAGWNRDQIAAPTGYTPRHLLAWASCRDCKPALQTGLLVTLRARKGRPPGKSNNEACNAGTKTK